ncbi:hypothetical protein HWQ67_16775 [Candidatus Magnetobacterium casensis]|uniref:Uncharacterized protein n=1 Tax=Candidatus Magnetobacterium casense TaxID=1455061 RepID=A0ABS6S320_9BACT|nr:hypothetical protein [Candidatus Magnetobacterium casensis]
MAVNKNECVKLTREGKPTQFWAEPKQPWMLRKSALKRALVEAFPSLFAGTLATAEVESDIEGELPAAFEDNGQPDWPKFWVRVQNELKLTEEEAHKLLGVESVKQMMADDGLTLEQVFMDLVDKVRESRATEAYPQPMDEDYEPLFDDSAALIDKGWLNESLKTLKDWNAARYIRETFPEAKGKTIGDAIDSLTPDQKAKFVAEVQKRLEAKAKS